MSRIVSIIAICEVALQIIMSGILALMGATGNDIIAVIVVLMIPATLCSMMFLVLRSIVTGRVM